MKRNYSSKHWLIQINKCLVKEEQIKTKPMDRLFEVFNLDRTKNGEVIRFVPLKLEINGYTEKIDVAVPNLNSMDMFLEYDRLIKYNPEVNWNKGTIWFTICLR